ncbi:MAG: [Thermoguttaceae bacterium]|nr:[FeFe] hydrogenase H-cluster radical SAM maturase HydE [Thermoguttaceae bacterium]
MNHHEILTFLRASGSDLEPLWTEADAIRRANVGDAIHLRGLIEVSNICTAQCTYCGIRVKNPNVHRYKMTIEEILESVRLAQRFGYGTIVLQSGETPAAMPDEWVTEVIREIRKISSQAITLSLGERPANDYQAYCDWAEAGANRYLIRFETSNPELFRKLHPGHPGLETRLLALRKLREAGFEIGSGVMVGVPGQTWDDLANDIEMFSTLDLDMIGVGPFLPHPETPLGQEFLAQQDQEPQPEQVPNDELTTLKTVALTRLVCPKANIPATTALACIDRAQGHRNGLTRGANVIMPNVTPAKYRRLYEIYPSKATTAEAAEQFDRALKEKLLSLGRTIGKGPGNSARNLD